MTKQFRRILLSSLIIVILSSACGMSQMLGGDSGPALATSAPLVMREESADSYASEWESPAGGTTGGDSEPNDEDYGDVFFENYGVNPRIDTLDDHLSTFAVDVDTASYTIMRRVVLDGNLPDKDSVRVEEYVNYFDMDYDIPDTGAFSISIDGAPSPWAENYHLIRVGLQGYEVPEEERPDAVLTFVVDVSGSMNMENRLELVKDSLELLVEELRPTDKVGLVIYGSEGEVLLEPEVLSNSRAVLRAIDRLEPGGSTNAEEGLRLAYELAREYYVDDGINRVILCSDGVANVGNTGHESIWDIIERDAGDGIYLTSVGFGMGNYNDELMEQLADNGNGFYAYVDDIVEARRVFVDRLPSSLQVIARDTKVQVDFNPNVVRSYRLIGYENRDVADEDFRNDEVDAGELGPGHSVTALYEVRFNPDADTSELAMIVYMRWEDPETTEVIEINEGFSMYELEEDFTETDDHFQLAAVVAQYAEVLRESYWAKDAGTQLTDLVSVADRIAESISTDEDVQEFAKLVERATRNE